MNRMGITHNSLLRGIVNDTNIFVYGSNFSKMHNYSGHLLDSDEYTLAEFLTGVKIVIGDIFRGCKIISINGKENENEINISGHPIIYNKAGKARQVDEVRTFTFKRNDFAILKHKR